MKVEGEGWFGAAIELLQSRMGRRIKMHEDLDRLHGENSSDKDCEGGNIK